MIFRLLWRLQPRSLVSRFAVLSGLAIVRSIIDLAKNLGLEVVAEGVENLGIMQELTRQGCTTAQGFFISRPVSAESLGEWLAESSYANRCAA